jgi:DNA-binding SARP family transcriptional activator
MLRAGAVEAVVRAARGVPAERRSALVEQIEGEARQVRGDWEGALACFRRAAGDGDRLPAGLAWRMGLIHYLRAELEESLAVYERGRLDGGQPADESLLLSWQATSHWLKGDRGTCRSLVRRALALADRTGDPRALAAAHTVLAMLASVAGEGPSSEEHSHLALEAAERAGDLLQVIRIRNNRASHFLDEGRYEEALEDLRACIHLAEVTGFSFFIALGRVNRAAARFHLGRLEEAIADYEAARVIYRRLGSRSVGYALRGLADVCLSRGDLAVARSCYEQALEMAEEAGDVQVLVPVLSGLARVVAAEDPEHAAALVDRALATEPGVAHVGALLTAGWVALRWGDRRAAAERAALAAEESRRRNDRAGLAESLELEVMSAPRPAALLPRLEEALGIWRSLRDSPGQTRAQLTLATISPHPTARAMGARAEERLRSMGVRVAAAAEAAGLLGSLPRPEGPPVLLQTLGSFRVVREGRPVPTTEWQSKKARDLLKVLVARRGRSASREYLGEVLWPEEDPARVANRLSVALSVVRSILDPRREHDPDHFIAADKESVALDQPNLPVDVEVFLAEARSGLGLVRGGRTDEARAVLESAETAYTGDFLEEDPYEDFAGPLREEARAAYVAVARTLAQVTAEGGEQDAAVRYYLRVLERDPYDEPANLDLVACLARSGRHGEARRHYRTYVARMAELDVEPAPFPATG